MKRLMVGLAALGLIGFGMVGSPRVDAAAGVCSGVITGTTGSLIVPSDASSGQCELDGAIVNGNVTVQAGGDLNMHNCTKIAGSLTATNAERINIWGCTSSKIGGNLTMTGSSSDALESDICSLTLGGTLQVSGVSHDVIVDGDPNESSCDPFGGPFGGGGPNGPVVIGGHATFSNNSGLVELAQATVNGSVNVTGNSANADPEGSAELEGNKINGGLSCTNNVHGVTNGGPDGPVEPNTAASKSGQCVGL
jgi:hypothetical protein